MSAHVYPPASLVEDNAGAWLKTLAKYRQPRLGRSAFELFVTLVPFAIFWAAACFSLTNGFWPGLIAILPASAFLLRLFMIQHDCGHGSFFARRGLDDWTGRVLGILTLTPYDYWRRAHAAHHATAGNLDQRGVGDITTLTIAEYRALSPMKRLGYRLYRHPLVMFGIGPAWLFLFKQRLPFGIMNSGALPWISTMATNLAIVTLAGVMVWAVGLGTFLLIHLPVVLLAGAAGVWLFYVQHQFEETHWSAGDHLSSRIPYYRLPEVLRDHPQLAGIGRITLWDSLKCVRLVLWDDRRRRLVSFRDAAGSLRRSLTEDGRKTTT
jgi:omega-6 fatty acid desaturase (delta-12 desaturase)